MDPDPTEKIENNPQILYSHNLSILGLKLTMNFQSSSGKLELNNYLPKSDPAPDLAK